MYIGTNLDGNAENESAAPWNDCVHQWNPWTDQTGATYLTAAQVDGKGWPLVAAKTVCGMHGYEDGPGYKLSYIGSDAQSITFQGCLSFDAWPVKDINGIWRANVTKAGDGLGILVKGGTTAISLIRPTGNSNQIWHQRYVDLASKFAVLRFMDLLRTNNSAVKEWVDRPTLDSFPWTGHSGIPLETVFELMARTYRNGYLCIPHMASNDFVTNFGNMTAAGVPGGLRMYTEYSNELWNFNFGQWKDTGILAAASTVPGLPAPDPGRTDGWGFNRTVAWQGVRAVQVASLLKKAWSNRPADLRPLIGNDRVNTWWANFGMQSSRAILGSKVSDYFWGQAVAAYVYLKDDSAMALPDVDHLFALLPDRLNACLNGEPGADGLVQCKALADAWGINSCCYESLQHITSGTPTDAVKAAAQIDPRMGQFYTQAYTAIDKLGYSFVNHDSTIGVARWWPLLPDWNTAHTPKFDAVMALQSPLPLPPIPMVPTPKEGCGVLTLNGKQKWFMLTDTMP